MDKERVRKIIMEKEVENGMKQEFEQSLPSRVKRYMQINVPWLLPNHHFAPFSAQCVILFRDGHFYSCIVAVQAIGEATVRFLCDANGWKPGSSYEANIKRLEQRKFISATTKASLLEIWKNRND